MRSVQRRAGHTLMWIATITEGRSPGEFGEPPAACCSNLKPLPEPIPSLPPLDFVVEYLVRFEMSAAVGDACWRRYDAMLRNSPYPAIRGTQSDVNIRRCLTSLDVAGLMAAAVDLVEAFILVQHHKAEGRGPAEPLSAEAHADINDQHLEMVRMHLLFSVLALAARGTLDRVPWRDWREAARARGVETSLATFLDTADALFTSRSANAWAIFLHPPAVNGGAKAWRRSHCRSRTKPVRLR